MHQGDHARALGPALLGPLRLSTFRARRLELGRVAGAPGEADRSVSAALAREAGTSLDAEAALHVHEYQVAGRRVRGLVGLATLDPLTTRERAGAAVLPHEGVDPGRVARLVRRMAELGLDPAPILLTPLGATGPGPDPVREALQRVTAREPQVRGVDARRHAHRLWQVQHPDDVATLTAAVAAGRYLLADGHHRWAAHLELLARRGAGVDPHDAGDGHALVMVMDATDAPVLHALHRVARAVGMDPVLDAFADAGLTPRPSRSVGSPGPSEAPLRLAQDEVVVAGAGHRVRVSVPHDESATVVEQVHAALDPLVGAQGWSYHHRVGAALRQARTEPRAVALALPPPPPAEVAAAARAGRLLPVKATSFQPKPPFGVLYRSWRDG